MRNILKYGCFLLCFMPVFVMGMPLEEAAQYQILSPAVTQELVMQQLMTEQVGKTPVIEFFSYGCHWCHDLEPFLQSWATKKPKDTVLIRVPVIFHPTWRPLAKAYFTAQALNESQKLDPLFFKALHEDHVVMASDEDVRNFFIKQGIPAAKFDEAYASFAVNRSLTWAEEMARLYQIKQVPTLVVVGHKNVYLTTLQAAGGKEKMGALLDEMLKLD